MFCENCGAEIMDGSKICVMCGAPTTGVQPDGQNGWGLGDEASSSPSDEPSKSLEDFIEDDLGHMPNTSAKSALADFYEEDDASFVGDDSDFFVAPGDEDSADTYDPAGGSRRSKPAGRRPRVAIVAGVIVALVCVVGIAGLAYAFWPTGEKPSAEPAAQPEKTATSTVAAPTNQTNQNPAPAAEPAKKEIVVPVEIDGLDGEGSRIPVRAIGTRSDGIAAEETGYVAYDGTGLSLAAGTYRVTVMESPISAEGALYTIPSEGLELVVAEDGSTKATNDGARLTLTERDATTVMDNLIESAHMWITKDPLKADIADELEQRARTRRSDALAAARRTQDAEEEAARAESEPQNDTTSDRVTFDNYDNSDDYTQLTPQYSTQNTISNEQPSQQDSQQTDSQQQSSQQTDSQQTDSQQTDSQQTDSQQQGTQDSGTSGSMSTDQGQSSNGSQTSGQSSNSAFISASASE